MHAMVEGHQRVAEELEARINQTPSVAPEEERQLLTMSLNQWAADTYRLCRSIWKSRARSRGACRASDRLRGRKFARFVFTSAGPHRTGRRDGQ